MSDALTKEMLQGSRTALARLLTRIENREDASESILRALSGKIGRALRIGVTGPPGAGKSTLVSAYTKLLRKSGQKIAVLAVDPTSPFSGGALLGDRVRMNSVCLDQGVFIRSLATSRGNFGGLSKRWVIWPTYWTLSALTSSCLRPWASVNLNWKLWNTRTRQLSCSCRSREIRFKR